jgi:hypothetical protein
MGKGFGMKSLRKLFSGSDSENLKMRRLPPTRLPMFKVEIPLLFFIFTEAFHLAPIDALFYGASPLHAHDIEVLIVGGYRVMRSPMKISREPDRYWFTLFRCGLEFPMVDHVIGRFPGGPGIFGLEHPSAANAPL